MVDMPDEVDYLICAQVSASGRYRAKMCQEQTGPGVDPAVAQSVCSATTNWGLLTPALWRGHAGSVMGPSHSGHLHVLVQKEESQF